MNKYGVASTAPLASKVADLVPNGTDAADGNTMYTATVELATMLSRIELSGNLTCTNLGVSAYSKLVLTHIGLNGVHQQFTLGGKPVGNELYDKTNQGGYPVSVPACFMMKHPVLKSLLLLKRLYWLVMAIMYWVSLKKCFLSSIQNSRAL